jgi:hypothetical protein
LFRRVTNRNLLATFCCLMATFRLLFVRFGFVLVALRLLWVPFRFLIVAFVASDVPECRMFVVSAQATIRDATRTGSNTSSKLGKAKTNKGVYQAKGLGPRRASGKEGIVLPCHATEPWGSPTDQRLMLAFFDQP